MVSLLIRIQNLQKDIFETILEDLSVWDINEIAKINRGHYEIVKSSLDLVKRKVFQVQEYEEIQKNSNSNMQGTPWVIQEFLLSANLEILLKRDSLKHESHSSESNLGISSMLTENLYIFLKTRFLRMTKQELETEERIVDLTEKPLFHCLVGRKTEVLKKSGILDSLSSLKKVERHRDFAEKCELVFGTNSGK